MQEQLCLDVISQIFTNIAQNSPKKVQNRRPTVFFDALQFRSCSLHQYFCRIVKYGQIPFESAILSIMLLLKLTRKQPNVAVCPRNIYALMLTSLVVATKYHSDDFFSNRYYSQVGGCTVDELNEWEREFLTLIDFDCHTTPQEYNDSFNGVMKRIQLAQKQRVQQNSELYKTTAPQFQHSLPKEKQDALFRNPNVGAQQAQQASSGAGSRRS